jgi:hypothetical protein
MQHGHQQDGTRDQLCCSFLIIGQIENDILLPSYKVHYNCFSYAAFKFSSMSTFGYKGVKSICQLTNRYLQQVNFFVTSKNTILIKL